jgi:tyrosinase
MPSVPNPKKTKPPVPETVGATSGPFELGAGVSTTSFGIHAPTGPALLRSDTQPKRVLLRLENVRSTIQVPSFDVYLNVPPGADPENHPELHAFTMSTFGLAESSRPKGDHPGDGLNIVREVTDLYTRLSAAKDWNPNNLRVSFVAESWDDHPVKVTVGRVSLVIE